MLYCGKEDIDKKRDKNRRNADKTDTDRYIILEIDKIQRNNTYTENIVR